MVRSMSQVTFLCQTDWVLIVEKKNEIDKLSGERVPFIIRHRPKNEHSIQRNIIFACSTKQQAFFFGLIQSTTLREEQCVHYTVCVLKCFRTVCVCMLTMSTAHLVVYNPSI